MKLKKTTKILLWYFGVSLVLSLLAVPVIYMIGYAHRDSIPAASLRYIQHANEDYDAMEVEEEVEIVDTVPQPAATEAAANVVEPE